MVCSVVGRSVNSSWHVVKSTLVKIICQKTCAPPAPQAPTPLFCYNQFRYTYRKLSFRNEAFLLSCAAFSSTTNSPLDPIIWITKRELSLPSLLDSPTVASQIVVVYGSQTPNICSARLVFQFGLFVCSSSRLSSISASWPFR